MTFTVVTRPQSLTGNFKRPVAATITESVADQRAWSEYFRSLSTINMWRDDK